MGAMIFIIAVYFIGVAVGIYISRNWRKILKD
nr:MAG TPA: protein of unknown function (DUF4535) [Caudoviricetes sp.]